MELLKYPIGRFAEIAVLLCLGLIFLGSLSNGDTSLASDEKRPAYSGPFGSITLEKLRDGFDVDPGLEKEVGEFIAQTLFGQDKSAKKDSDRKGGGSVKKKTRDSSENDKATSSKVKIHVSKKSKNKLKTGPYSPVPTVNDASRRWMRRTGTSSLRNSATAAEAQIEEDRSNLGTLPRDEAVEILSALGKSYENGELSEEDLAEFIKGIDLEFDDPKLLEEFMKRNENSGNTQVFKADLKSLIGQPIESDVPIGAPFQQDGGLQSDDCISTIFSWVWTFIQFMMAIILLAVLLQIISSCTCINLSECFNFCSLADWAQSEPEPRPKSCFWDNIPTACDLLNVPCNMFGCKGGCGWFPSICDILPSGGRVPKEQRGKKGDDCEGLMQSFCKAICTDVCDNAGADEEEGGAAQAVQDEGEDDEMLNMGGRGGGHNPANFVRMSQMSPTDPNALYMAVKHQRGGEGYDYKAPRNSSRNRRARARSGSPQNPYWGYSNVTTSNFGRADSVGSETDTAAAQDRDYAYNTGGFQSPRTAQQQQRREEVEVFVDDDDELCDETSERASVSTDALGTSNVGMHPYYKGHRRM